MRRYAYLITRPETDPDREGDRRVMSRGVETDPCGQGPRVLAEQLLIRNRIEHSYYDGPRRCEIWPYSEGAPLPRLAPVGAEQYDD
ncbi:hypothetical protein [Streptomyces pini]|uniref:Uncharacterized protein n=1 Tax=Streptomyces pini TaxID=1520580 RepID=A0A1I4C0B7_9ACTN|nr:hypothetical protein [Streptomyces pini]SFK73789.1 hypothetical protein SAMN05192584_108187 [Streptomyces pini]